MTNNLKRAYIMEEIMKISTRLHLDIYTRFDDYGKCFHVMLVDKYHMTNVVPFMFHLNKMSFKKDEFKESMRMVMQHTARTLGKDDDLWL